MRQGVAAVDDLQAQAECITQDYIGVFNAMAAKRRFIGTMEREEVVDALHKVWALLPQSIDLRQLECFRPQGRFPVDSCKIPSRCRGPFATTPSSSDRSG